MSVCLNVDIMRVSSGILIQLGQLVNLKQWMVSQGNTQNQDPGVIQEGLNSLQLYVQIDQRVIVLHVELNIKSGSALQHLLFVSNVTNKAIILGYVSLRINLPQVHPIPIRIQGDHGMAEVEAVEAVRAMDPNVLYMKLRYLILQNLQLMLLILK